MKSKAHIKGHPLHPILVSFPIAFFIGTLVFDILGWYYRRDDFHSTAMYLEIGGICFGLLAAVPGFIDYLFIVPPHSSAKRRATTHGLVNVSMLIIFAAALLLRQNENASTLLIIALEIVGVVLLGISGWLGGTLVYRNQIGVDIRYANAGKWKEEFKHDVDETMTIETEDDLQVNQMKLLHIDGNRIVVCKTEKGYVAFQDHCTHRGGSLAGGSLICGTVQCPWHGSQFDVFTGSVMAGPATNNISTYSAKTVDGKVIIALHNRSLLEEIGIEK
jgi:uncharacterized membrane protein/nitrite reductase/ring-hydroxylating ferredoxin subunit